MTPFIFRETSAALLQTVGGWAVAADPPKPGVPLVPASVPTFRAKQVVGTTIGTVDDIVFDDAGNRDYPIGATEDNKPMTLPWEAAKFDLEKKTGVVSITRRFTKRYRRTRSSTRWGIAPTSTRCPG